MVIAAKKLKDTYTLEEKLWPTEIAYSKHHISTNGIYLVPVFPHAYKYLLFFLFPKHVEIDGETVETVSDFIFGGSKITADGDCSHEIKRRFTPWKEMYD